MAVRAVGPGAARAAGGRCRRAAGLPQRALQARAERVALRAAARRPRARGGAARPVPRAADNLALFYAALGERRYAEQQVKTLFGLAAKNGLTLSQGEYKAGYDRNARCTPTR
jgi:hypothetical protein